MDNEMCCKNPDPDESIPKDAGAGYPIKVCRSCFESGEPVSFAHALYLLRKFPNMKVARSGWNGKGMYIQVQVPDEGSKMGLPYIYISTVDGKLVPWLASQTDLLSDDWVLFKDAKSS